MGRSLQKQESQIALKHHGPGCMWGILHNLQQNRWHKVVKRLPRARLVHGRHSNVAAEDRAKPSSSNAEQLEQDNNNVEPSLLKSTVDPSPSHKSSMKSRIKAFTDEVYKRKGRHRRSTSYPVRKPPDENLPSHQKGKSLDGVVPQSVVDQGSHQHHQHQHHHHVRLNYLKQNEVDQLGDQPIRDHTLVHGNLIYAIEPSRGDALQESKLFMDALTLLNVREEMFLNILKDPSISLTNQLHCRRSPNLRYGLNKSMSFAASAPSVARDFDDLEASRRKHESRCDEDDEAAAKESCEVLDNAASPAAAAANILRKKSDENRASLIHFKNIREKIKYVIRDRKKEKNRIMMDALHHRVPYGVSPSKKLAEDTAQPTWSDFGKSSIKEYKRTTSFDNSLDRYNQLLDESKPSAHPTKPATLARILSLPDIRSHIPDIRFNPLMEITSVSENRNQEQVIKDETSSADESSPDPPMPSNSEAAEQHQPSVSHDSRFSLSQELDVSEEEEQLYSELMMQGDDAKNNAEFNYVRGVLELSGLTRNEEVLGEYPLNLNLNPSMFEEYCCAPNQEEEEEEYGISNQILLFDLINQVLLGIHERSFYYWPAPLTTRSTMHPLPKGSRVLEQVWGEIKSLLTSAPQSDQDMDYAVTHDLSRNDGWMNLQLDAECVALELEELIFDDLLDHIFSP